MNLPKANIQFDNSGINHFTGLRAKKVRCLKFETGTNFQYHIESTIQVTESVKKLYLRSRYLMLTDVLILSIAYERAHAQ